MKPSDLPPLPEELVEEMRALRRVEPPSDLIERTFEGLPERNTSTHIVRASAGDSKSSKWPLARLALLNVTPAMAIAALLVYVFIGRNVPSQMAEIIRSEERQVALPEEGQAWTELALQTHHHAEEPAVVHVDVPTHVGVRFPDGNGESLESQCSEERCVHRFMHSNGGTPLRVALRTPADMRFMCDTNRKTPAFASISC